MVDLLYLACASSGPYSVTVSSPAPAQPSNRGRSGVQVALGIGTADRRHRPRHCGAGNRDGVSAVDPVFSSSRTGAATSMNRVISHVAVAHGAHR